MNYTKLILSIIVAIAVLSGCAASQSGSAYTRAQARQVQEVQMGKVESVRSPIGWRRNRSVL